MCVIVRSLRLSGSNVAFFVAGVLIDPSMHCTIDLTAYTHGTRSHTAHTHTHTHTQHGRTLVFVNAIVVLKELVSNLQVCDRQHSLCTR